jgi:hypothetical protein
MFVEAAIARLTMLRMLLVKPLHHEQVLTAIFGHFQYEQETSKELQFWHPWIKHISDDFKLVHEYIEDLEWCALQVGEDPWLLLFAKSRST